MFWSIERWARTYQKSGTLSARQFWIAYFRYPAIQTYLALIVISFAFAFQWGVKWYSAPVSAVLVVLLYPFAEYLLHRYVLHDNRLCRSALTSVIWKRIHFDHHRDPKNLSVLFGAPYTVLPLLAVLTMPGALLLDGPAEAATLFGFALISFCVYEAAHCASHLDWAPTWRVIKWRRKAHHLHHYHNETGNFGIATTIADRIFGSSYGTARALAKSPTVRSLGYGGAAARTYPWVARLTPDWGKRTEDG